MTVSCMGRQPSIGDTTSALTLAFTPLMVIAGQETGLRRRPDLMERIKADSVDLSSAVGSKA